MRLFHRFLLIAAIGSVAAGLPAFAQQDRPPRVDASAPKQLLWGDTHLHSSNSFDAYLNRNASADPDTAYRYAKGLPVIHPYHRARVQIETPLDFLVVSDHAEYLGVIRTIVESGVPTDELGWIDTVKAWYTEAYLRGVVEDDEGMAAFSSFLPNTNDVQAAAAEPRTSTIPGAEAISANVWQEAIRTADAHNDPGTFTTLIGWEWSSIPAGANLHRVVFTSADASIASQFQPFSSTNSAYPEDLWTWLAETNERTGAEFVAIPHNSNISKGYMFSDTSLRGEPFTNESARTRQKWEPVVEITQIKGDSETHPELSPADPFANFEIYPHYIQIDAPPYVPTKGDYIRPALRRGLAIEERIGFNPYRFGVIGSTDSHSGMASAEEPNFWGKLARDSVPENKQSISLGSGGPSGWSMGASGLAAVWADAHDRESILEAFRRREVYATTGPRIRVEVRGGWGDRAAAGAPMGGTLPPRQAENAPSFVVAANRDPRSAYLDRIQIIKGWIDTAGQTHEQVYDVAWSGDRTPSRDGSVPAVGNTVNPKTGEYRNTIGTPTLAAHWTDPQFDPSQSAFYYLRVLEIPTPRHSLFDALALGLDPESIEGTPWWIQERAYTSPIWYNAPQNPALAQH